MFVETKNLSKNLAEMTPVYVGLVLDFKKCCMKTGNYDGSVRDYYFRD